MPRQQQQLQQHWSRDSRIPRQQQQLQHSSRDCGMPRQQQQLQQHLSRDGGMPRQQQQLQQHWSPDGGIPRQQQQQQQQQWSRGGGNPHQHQRSSHTVPPARPARQQPSRGIHTSGGDGEHGKNPLSELATEAVPDTSVFPAASSKAVAEAPTSSAGAASTAVPAAAPETGGTVFPTTSVGGAARATDPTDETAASKAAPETDDTVFPTTSIGGAPGECFNDWGGRGYDDSVPGMTPKQPLPGIRLHDPLHGRQVCPEFNSFHQGLGQINPSEGLFSCRPLPKRGEICYIPAPPPQSLNESGRPLLQMKQRH